MPETILIDMEPDYNTLPSANPIWGLEREFLVDVLPSDSPSFSGWLQFTIPVGPSFPLRSQLAQFCLNMQYSNTSSIAEQTIGGSVCGWVEKINSFTSADVLENYKDELQSLLLRYKTSLSGTSQYREKLSNRLAELLHDLEEDDEDSISIDSLTNFYNFCQINRRLKFPDISLTPDGNIYASWSGEKNRVFSILFLPKGNVHFALLEPNERYPERQSILSGELTFDTVMDKVKPYNVMAWIGE